MNGHSSITRFWDRLEASRFLDRLFPILCVVRWKALSLRLLLSKAVVLLAPTLLPVDIWFPLHPLLSGDAAGDRVAIAGREAPPHVSTSSTGIRSPGSPARWMRARRAPMPVDLWARGSPPRDHRRASKIIV